MSRFTVKSSTVFVSVDDETRVFRSVDEVPPEWRRKFERPKGGLKPQTILIADRKGKEEIMRSLQGRPSAVTTRWKGSSAASSSEQSSVFSPASSRQAQPAAPSPIPGLTASQQLFVEIGFVAMLAGLIYAAFSS